MFRRIVHIRDLNTTSFSKINISSPTSFHSCFIDVFPLDYVSDNLKEQKKQAKKIEKLTYWWHKENMCQYYTKNFKNTLKTLVIKTHNLFTTQDKMSKKIDYWIKKYGQNKSSTLAMVSFMPGVKEFYYPAKCYDEFITVPFEDIEINIPKDYDTLLRKQYGDYMKFPSNKDGSGSIHGKTYYDLDHQFEYYKNKYTQQQLNELFDKFEL